MSAPPPLLTPEQKDNWNKFIDFVATQKMAGSPMLDQRNKQLGMGLLQKFNYANPKMALPLDIIPKVQQELQDHRANLIQQWKAGKMQPDESVKTEADLMPNISPVDGWPGSKTLSSKFPTAVVSVTTPTGTTVKNLGTDMEAYMKAKGK